jgi:hypothetical protein
MTDNIFFSALLGSEADVSVTVGGTALQASWARSPDDGVGIYHGSAEFGSATGDVVITISRSGSTVVSLSPGADGSIGTQSCVDGLQNWNAYVASAWGGGSVSATPSLTVSEQKCINGTGYENFAGLCDFACEYGYCDHSACVCKAMGSPRATPSQSAPTGYPAAGLDDSYSGVCAFDCEHGYCPPSACSDEASPLTTPTVSDFSPPACRGGSALAGAESSLAGLCSYACNFGFCPYLVCSCDEKGALNETPAIIDGDSGEAADGVEDHDLCAFACARGYCPSPTCVDTSAASGSSSSGGGGGGVFTQDPGWDSMTGQDCLVTPCSVQPTWASDQETVTVYYHDDCPSGQVRTVICPLSAEPGECTWRGSAPFCHSTCDVDEVMVATSSYGSENCTVGVQSLCCKSNTWTDAIASCSWDGATCASGQTAIATRRRPSCFVQCTYERPLFSRCRG